MQDNHKRTGCFVMNRLLLDAGYPTINLRAGLDERVIAIMRETG